jgi:hypothetical protein
VGDGSHFVFRQKRKCETGHCHGETARSVLAKVRGYVFARFRAVAAKRGSRTGIHSLAYWDGASRYHNPYIDGGTSPEYFGKSLICANPGYQKLTDTKRMASECPSRDRPHKKGTK